MKEQLITEITRKMLPYLDNSQMEQLQEVLTHCFWGVQISPSSEEERLQEKETNKELLEMFISSKRVEGCSEKTLKYYNTTILLYYGCSSQLLTPLFPHTPRLSVVKHVVKNRFLNTLVTGDRKRFL